MDEIIKLQIPQILSAYIFIAIILVIVKKRGIPRDKEIFIASIRMTLQLILTGYILTYVFGHENPFVSILIVCIMETFAINNIFKRIKHHIDKPLKKVIISAMLIGTVSCLIFFIFIIF